MAAHMNAFSIHSVDGDTCQALIDSGAGELVEGSGCKWVKVTVDQLEFTFFPEKQGRLHSQRKLNILDLVVKTCTMSQ